jgi:Ion channel
MSQPSAPKTGLFRFTMRQFLAALIILVVTYPFIIDLDNGELIENILMMVLLISAVLVVGGRSRILAIVLVIPALTGSWLNQWWHGLVPLWLITGTHMVFVGFVISRLIRFIQRETRVNAEVLCAGISAYLMIAVFFTPAYLMISELRAGAFAGPHLGPHQGLTRFDALYLSFVSLTCVGCNDITAVSKVARMVLMVESTAGVLCLAILIARLVALHSHPGQGGPGQGAELL